MDKGTLSMDTPLPLQPSVPRLLSGPFSVCGLGSQGLNLPEARGSPTPSIKRASS